jgi:hypothetical protein
MTPYSRPEIVDHGSLEALTADFDLHFVGSVAKLVTMAVASGPMVGGGDLPEAVPSAAPEPPVGFTEPDVGTAPADDGGAGGTRGSGGVLEERASRGGDLLPRGGGADTGGARPGVSGSPGANDAGGLPFTGYAAWAAAALGATITTTGWSIRRMLRRRT